MHENRDIFFPTGFAKNAIRTIFILMAVYQSLLADENEVFHSYYLNFQQQSEEIIDRLPTFTQQTSLKTRAIYYPAGLVLGGPKRVTGFVEKIDLNKINTVVVDIREKLLSIAGSMVVDLKSHKPYLWPEANHNAPKQAVSIPGLLNSGIVNTAQACDKVHDAYCLRWTLEMDDILNELTVRRSFELSAIITEFKEHGLNVVLRLPVFKDSELIKIKPSWAIQTQAGLTWGKGKTWLNPWHPELNAFTIELALRGLASGADGIQFDYVRLPGGEDGKLNEAVFDYRKDGQENCNGINAFLERAHHYIRHFFPTKTISVDVFGFIAIGQNRCGEVGQNIAQIAPFVDEIWPMNYPSHWVQHRRAKVFGTNYPEQNPELVYRKTTQLLRSQLSPVDRDRIKIIPWIETAQISRFFGNSLVYVHDRVAYIQEQIDGIENGEGNGFAVWTYPRNIDYLNDALRTNEY